MAEAAALEPGAPEPGEAPTPEPERGVQWTGLFRDVVNVGAAGADVGFRAAREGAGAGFATAATVLRGLSWLGNAAVEGNPASTALDAAGTVMGASGRLADAVLSASHHVTKVSLGATSDALLACGATEGELLRVMGVDGDTADAMITVQKLLKTFGTGMVLDAALVQDLAILSALQHRAGIRGEGAAAVASLSPAPAVAVDDALAYLPHTLATYSEVVHTFLGLQRHLPSRASQEEGPAVVPTPPPTPHCVHDGTTEAVAHIARVCGVPAAAVLRQRGSVGAYQPSHFVAFDRARNEVVVSFRGTMAVQDALTDLICEHEAYTFRGTAGLMHKGFCEAARRLAPQLEPVIMRGLAALATPDAAVVLTGHSLGAAVATALTAYWLNDGTAAFAGHAVRCYAYAPPCVFSQGVAMHEALRAAVRAVMVGEDVVPRLCYGSAWDLRGRVLQLQALRRESPQEYHNLYDMAHAFADGGAVALQRSNAAATYALLADPDPACERLYPAGTLYHTSSPTAGDWRLLPLAALLPGGILLSGTMFSDHMPQVYARLLAP
eukprot:TRINITY_DN5198_c0_g1_i1.p1 TRINITY_DN5198_c0_g1~~TRINITY_DN5198_c0_g1_i1.p1  ORF type:complete len:552 (+),score=120.70 TRINITY_DN5198_c0_g1_i1:216-1871(+)